jgi:hypothetical protein
MCTAPAASAGHACLALLACCTRWPRPLPAARSGATSSSSGTSLPSSLAPSSPRRLDPGARNTQPQPGHGRGGHRQRMEHTDGARALVALWPCYSCVPPFMHAQLMPYELLPCIYRSASLDPSGAGQVATATAVAVGLGSAIKVEEGPQPQVPLEVRTHGKLSPISSGEISQSSTPHFLPNVPRTSCLDLLPSTTQMGLRTVTQSQR